jgi:NADPH:quinone reductase-like Zn-dependent oxidoreductase
MSRPATNQEIGTAIARLLDAGHVRPIVGQRFALERAGDALQVIDRREALGKVVLDVVAA